MDVSFSIIVPLYNAKIYLQRCVDSIINQTYKNWNLLLIDDGSTDGSADLCDSISSENSQIKVIHKINGGVSESRNRGIVEAEGEWLFFVDADDFLEQDTLSRISEIIHQYSPDLVLFKIKEVSVDGIVNIPAVPLMPNQLYDRNGIEKKVLPFACDYDFPFINSPWNKVFLTSIIREHCIQFPQRSRGEDWIFNIEYLKYAQRLVFIDVPLYNYVRNLQSAMSKYYPEQFQWWVENWQIRCELINNYNLKVNLSRMSRVFYSKVFYYIQDIKKNEPCSNINNKIKSIFSNSILKDSIQFFPTNMRELRAWVYIKFSLFRYLYDKF